MAKKWSPILERGLVLLVKRNKWVMSLRKSRLALRRLLPKDLTIRQYDSKNIAVILPGFPSNRLNLYIIDRVLAYTMARGIICHLALNECRDNEEAGECSHLLKDCLLNDDTFMGILEQMNKEYHEKYMKILG